MKKILFICMLSLANYAIAQSSLKSSYSKEEIVTKSFSFGVEAGVNFNHFNRAGTDYGFRFGGTAWYKLGDSYSLRSGILYSQIGGQAVDRVVPSVPGSVITQRNFLNRGIRMHTVEVPLAIHFKHPESTGKNIYPDLFVGMAYNTVIKATERRDELWSSDVTTPLGTPVQSMLNDSTEDVTSSYKTFLFSAVIGSNLYINVSEDLNYFIGVEYKVGLHNVKQTPYPYGEKFKTNQLALKVGVVF